MTTAELNNAPMPGRNARARFPRSPSAQANEHYEPLCGAPRYRARPEA